MEADANQGTQCANPDEAMFPNAGAPLTPYTGYLLASALAQPNAQLSTLTTSSSDVLAFQSLLPNGKVAVMLISTNTSTSRKVTFGSSLTGYLTTQSYSAGDQNSAKSKIVPGSGSVAAIAGGVALPAESILVLKETTLKPSSMTLTGSASVKAGTKVTLNGKLTLNGVAAPAGGPVKAYRKLGSKTQATLTATTGA